MSMCIQVMQDWILSRPFTRSIFIPLEYRGAPVYLQPGKRRHGDGAPEDRQNPSIQKAAADVIHRSLHPVDIRQHRPRAAGSLVKHARYLSLAAISIPPPRAAIAAASAVR